MGIWIVAAVASIGLYAWSWELPADVEVTTRIRGGGVLNRYATNEMAHQVYRPLAFGIFIGGAILGWVVLTWKSNRPPAAAASVIAQAVRDEVTDPVIVAFAQTCLRGPMGATDWQWFLRGDSPDFGPAWRELRRHYQDGDEVLQFKPDPDRPDRGTGWCGYALVRDGQVVAVLVQGRY